MQEGLGHELVIPVIQISSSTSPLLLFYLYMPHPTPSPPSLHHIYPEIQLRTIISTCFSISALSLAILLHLNKKCSTSSTSPEPHCVQILSSLDSPTHLLDSTLSSAVPPLSLAKIRLRLFLPTCTHLDLHCLPISTCNTPTSIFPLPLIATLSLLPLTHKLSTSD